MISAAALISLSAFFLVIAAIYAAAGFGGGSSYLAILTLYLKDFTGIKTIGLLCNLVVVSGGTWLFGRHGYFDRKAFLPLICSGVPFAFLGAKIQLRQEVFFTALGFVLCISAVLLFMQLLYKKRTSKLYGARIPVWALMLISAGIGFIAGITGIGGGILLSPLLHLIGWDSPKKIAALASFFILVNSVAGLAGQISGGTFNPVMPYTPILLLAVFLGGQLGTRINIHRIRPSVVKGLTGLLVGYIGLRLVLKYTNGIDI